MTTFTPPEPNAALVVGADDVLVVSFPSAITAQNFEEIAKSFDTFPALKGRVALIVGAEIAVVQNPAPEPPS